nr:hypothetical protein [Bacteroides intestinalis]
MIRQIIFSILVLCPITGVTQNQNVPTEKCVACHGTGQIGYAYCPMCQGKGYVIKASFVAEGIAACANGQAALVRGDYQKAVEEFKKAMDHLNFEGVTYLGACIELGMGIKSDKNVALEFYTFAAKNGDQDAKAALSRIKTQGYWPATPEMQKQFCRSLEESIRTSSRTAVPPNSYPKNDSYPETTSNGRKCSGCNGTGICTMCQGRGGYWVDGINERVWHKCSQCYGDGKCRVCYGNGTIK